MQNETVVGCLCIRLFGKFRTGSALPAASLIRWKSGLKNE
jgi:hypothetical protein